MTLVFVVVGLGVLVWVVAYQRSVARFNEPDLVRRYRAVWTRKLE